MDSVAILQDSAAFPGFGWGFGSFQAQDVVSYFALCQEVTGDLGNVNPLLGGPRFNLT